MAYADFVTAMMALFLVLWLTSQDEKIKEAVERAFKNPFSSATKESTGIIPNKEANSTQTSKGEHDSKSPVEMEMLRRITEDLAKMFQQNPDEALNSVKLEITSEGLRINLFDRSRRPLFEADSAEPTEYGAWVVSTLAWEIARYTTFTVEIEGHTEAGRRQKTETYTDWELSSDRANAARRLLIHNGVTSTQIAKIAGFGSIAPMQGAAPTNDVNRRVAVLLKVKGSTKGSPRT